jgi:membrane-bound lytic murein transglycosylase A
MRLVRGGLCAALVPLLLAACASLPEPASAPRPASPPPHVTTPVSALPGWAAEDHLAAFAAYQAGCRAAKAPALREPCAEAQRLAPPDDTAARLFFETWFEAEVLPGPGLLTGYFAPEYEASDQPDEIFSAPVRPRPDGLERAPEGGFRPWLERAEIERSPVEALAYMRPEDLFFLQIQGSGYLTFPDGRRVRAAYAADNGRPFAGIARAMVERGLLPRDGTSGEAIRAWLAAHRGAEAQAVTDLNPRYVFFRLETDDDGHPVGAAGLPLPEGRAAAIDPAAHAWGEPLWLEADGGNLAGAIRSYRRLVMALDTGGAIRGPARADLYVGRGDAAGLEAGRIRHPLRLWRLVPKSS